MARASKHLKGFMRASETILNINHYRYESFEFYMIKEIHEVVYTPYK